MSWDQYVQFSTFPLPPQIQFWYFEISEFSKIDYSELKSETLKSRLTVHNSKF